MARLHCLYSALRQLPTAPEASPNLPPSLTNHALLPHVLQPEAAAAYFEAHPTFQARIEAALQETMRRKPSEPLRFLVRCWTALQLYCTGVVHPVWWQWQFSQHGAKPRRGELHMVPRC